MKKIISLALCAVLAVCFTACAKKADNTKKTEQKSQTMQTVLDTNEYVLYQNIFYNKQGGDYDGKPVVKKGVFSTLYDEYNSVTRYYVWGYNDQTKCCDWQWEVKFDDTSKLPSNGSTVEVSGNFVSDSNALDGYWITSPQVKIINDYQSPDCDVDMSTMSATLQRVQIINIQNKPDAFEGKSVYTYGRVMTPNSIQHPYYDSVYELSFDTKDEVPAIGIMVLIKGTISAGTIKDASVEITENY